MASGKTQKNLSDSGSPPAPDNSRESSVPNPETAKLQEERYQALIEDVADGFYEVDLRGNFKFFNDALCRIFGYPRHAIQDRNFRDFLDEENARVAFEAFNRIFKEGGSVADISWEVIRPNSERRFLEISAKLIVDGEGRKAGFRGIARDITETKNLQRQLVNAEKLASLGTLAAGVAHEINNPLGVILGFCELLLRKTEKGTQQYEDLETIERQGLLCKETVENLLSFARSEKQRREYSDLNAGIEEIAKIVRHLLEKSGITLVLDLGENLPPVKGDARQLQQVFLNLITNAMAAMETGGTLTIRSLLERSTRRAVALFQDTGTGIPPDHIDHIFEPFFTTKPEGQGTGLGLFVSYGIITGYGGTIECTSTPATALGKQPGTVFTVKLPTGSAADLTETADAALHMPEEK